MSKSVWNTLGISETTDISLIKQAYAEKLKSARPDENPIKFQRLREAREKAERLAKGGLKQNPKSIKVKQVQNDLETEHQRLSPTQSQMRTIERKPNVRKVTPNPNKKRSIKTVETISALPELRGTFQSDACFELFAWLSGGKPEISDQRLSAAFSEIEDLSIVQREEVDHLAMAAVASNFRNRPDDEYCREFGVDFGGDEKVDSAIVRLAETFGWFEDERRIVLDHDADLLEFVDRIRALQAMQEEDPKKSPISTFSEMIKRNPNPLVRLGSWVCVFVVLSVVVVVCLSIGFFYRVPETVRRIAATVFVSLAAIYFVLSLNSWI
jgi:hypothetical protein